MTQREDIRLRPLVQISGQKCDYGTQVLRIGRAPRSAGPSRAKCDHEKFPCVSRRSRAADRLFWSPFRQFARDNARNYEIAFAKLGSFSGSKPGFELACVTQLSEANASAC